MDTKKSKSGFIPQAIYDQIISLMPIVSVEAVIVISGSLLFLRRKNNPVARHWWFAGGRIHIGESFEETLYREVKEKLGLKLNLAVLLKRTQEFSPSAMT